MVQRIGFYAPFTENGEIMVSGVRASCFAVVLDVSPLIQHVATHMLHAPLRLACSFDFSLCSRETYDESGFSSFASAPASIAIKFSGTSKWIQVAAIALVTPLLSVAFVVEQVSMTPSLLIVLGALWATVASLRRGRRQPRRTRRKPYCIRSAACTLSSSRDEAPRERGYYEP